MVQFWQNKMDDPNSSPYRFQFRFLQSDGGSVPAVLPTYVIVPVFDYEHWVKIMSSAIEGAKTIYPEEFNEVIDSVLAGEFMDCSQIASCLLSNDIFLENFVDYLLGNGRFLGGVNNEIVQKQLVESNPNDSSNEQVKNLAQVDDSLDVMWGGAKEVVEYWIDLVQTLCFFLSGVNDALDVVSAIYDRAQRKKFTYKGEIQGVEVDIGDDGELIGDFVEFVPNILGDLAKGIAQSTMLALIADMIDVGVSFVLADITDTRLEAITCVLFNEITCDDAIPLNPPYKFDNETIRRTAGSLLLNIDAGLVGNFLAICLVGIEAINSFVSVFPIDEQHRNFRIGMRSPSSEWAEICDTCTAPTTWTQVFDFTISSHADFWTNVSPPLPPPFTLPELTVWVSGEGWGNGRIYDGARQREMSFLDGIWDSRNVTDIDIEYKLVVGTGGSFQFNNIVRQKLAGTTLSTLNIITPAGVSAGTFTNNSNIGNVLMNGCRLQVTGYQRAGNNNPNGATFIRRVTIKGTGDNPFV